MNCAHCGMPAACIGEYEGHGGDQPACDACCAHGNEDGHCKPLADYFIAERDAALKRAEVMEAVLDFWPLHMREMIRTGDVEGMKVEAARRAGWVKDVHEKSIERDEWKKRAEEAEAALKTATNLHDGRCHVRAGQGWPCDCGVTTARSVAMEEAAQRIMAEANRQLDPDWCDALSWAVSAIRALATLPLLDGVKR